MPTHREKFTEIDLLAEFVRTARRSTYAHVRREQFKLVRGEDFIDPGYEWTFGHSRSFSKRCGSPAPKYIEATRMMSVPAGLLNDDPQVRPSMHVFTSSKAAWAELNDDLQKHEKNLFLCPRVSLPDD